MVVKVNNCRTFIERALRRQIIFYSKKPNRNRDKKCAVCLRICTVLLSMFVYRLSLSTSSLGWNSNIFVGLCRISIKFLFG